MVLIIQSLAKNLGFGVSSAASYSRPTEFNRGITAISSRVPTPFQALETAPKRAPSNKEGVVEEAFSG